MQSVLNSFCYCLNFIRDQVEDICDQDMVAQPNGIRNHPAWVLGHLTVSCQAIGGEVGVSAWLPSSWLEQFGTGSIPIGNRDFYESKDVYLEALRDAEYRMCAAVIELNETQLDMPLPDKEYRSILPTIRDALTQVLVAHPATHAGQLTIWRRAMGLPAMSRPFL